MDASYAVSPCRKALAFVVLQREPELFDGAVASGDRINPVTTEVVTRVLHVRLGALERRDGLSYLWMGLAPLPAAAAVVCCGTGRAGAATP